MKRVLLLGVALASLLLGTGSASASDPLTCGAALGVHNSATSACTAAGTLTVDELSTPVLSQRVSIGPVADKFIGDVQVVLESPTGRLTQTCLYRATLAYSPSCLEDFEGNWSNPVATCSGRTSSGIGEWSVSCNVTPTAG